MELLGPSCGYVDMLNAATTEKLNQDKAEGREYQKSPIRPSAAGACTRELYHQLMAFHGKAKYDVPVNEPEVHRLLNLGHSIESHIIRQFELLADFFEIRYRQQVLSFEFLESEKDKAMTQWLEGSIDLVFWSPRWKCVADIKSKKDKWNAGYKSDWDNTSAKLGGMSSVKKLTDSTFWVDDLEAFLTELNEPFFEANFLQLNLYANSTFLKERGVDHGVIIQYNKNDSRLREIRFRPSEAVYKRTVGKFQTALNAAASGDESIAPKDYVLGSIKCAFCKFATQCWGSADSRKEFFKTFPKKKWPTDLERLGKDAPGLRTLFTSYTEQSKEGGKAEVTEAAIVKKLMELGVDKIKLDGGEVYEVKHLKEAIVLRRSKI